MAERLSNFDVLNFVNRIILVKHFEYMKNNLAKSVHKSLLFYDRLPGENWWWRTIIKGVRSYLALVNLLGKFCSDYAMTTTRIRSLFQNNAKVCCSDDNQSVFDQVNENLSKLEYL